MDCLRSRIKMDSAKVLSERKYYRFIDGLIDDARYFNLLLAHVSHIRLLKHISVIVCIL